VPFERPAEESPTAGRGVQAVGSEAASLCDSVETGQYDRLGLERPRRVDEERATVETVNWLLGPTDAASRSAGAGAIDASSAQPRDTNG
jgi:hypothetical protein